MNRKGGAMVEAAMIFPVVVLTVISVLMIMLYFYEQIDRQADIHIKLRAESGLICGNMFYGNDPSPEMTVYRGPGKIYAYDVVESDIRWIVNNREKQLYAEKYLIDESMTVRMADLAEMEGPEDE